MLRRCIRWWTLQRITKILHSTNPPITMMAEARFDQLQAAWPPHPEYGYDPFSTWERALQRSDRLLKLDGMQKPGNTVLEIGAGDGMLGVVLQAYGHTVFLTDAENWRTPRSAHLDFVAADSCVCLPFSDNTFDLVCSYNTFEHLPDPEAALRHIVRVTKPGGFIHLDFGPLYSSPWGLHVYRTFRMPYPQYLFSNTFIERKLDELGIFDLGRKRTARQNMNQWTVADYASLWSKYPCEVLTNTVRRNETCLSIVLKFPEAFQGRNLTVGDLTARGLMITLKKQ